ncbi:MAG: clostripain-related cysteine peptidase, partial [Candidatus Thorarchaeota archaeon]
MESTLYRKKRSVMTFKTTKNQYLQIIILLFIFTPIFQFRTPANHTVTKNYSALDLEVPTDLKSFSNKDTSNFNQWTIMAIVNAEAIFGEHAALDCLQELEEGFKLGSGIEVVALVDRIPGYDSSNGNWTNSRYYHIVPDNDTRVISSELIQEFNELNLGDPNTYRNFVLWAQSTYPAEKYALTYIGHGGAVSGFSFDISDGDQLTLDEFQQAMSGLYVDIVALDSCKMGTLELAYESRTFTDYIVFSEQFSVTEGLDYKAFIEELCNKPSMEPLELAEII